MSLKIFEICFYFMAYRSRQLNVTEMLRALVLPIGCATWEAYAITSAVRQDGPRSVDLCSRILNHPMWDSESVTHCMVSDLVRFKFEKIYYCFQIPNLKYFPVERSSTTFHLLRVGNRPVHLWAHGLLQLQGLSDNA